MGAEIVISSVGLEKKKKGIKRNRRPCDSNLGRYETYTKSSPLGQHGYVVKHQPRLLRRLRFKVGKEKSSKCKDLYLEPCPKIDHRLFTRFKFTGER